MKVKDLRTGKDTEIGDTVELAGDFSLLFLSTDKGYRLILETYNMKRIADYYISKGGKTEEEK